MNSAAPDTGLSKSAPNSEGPLYVRWGADRSPFAVELKLELVGQIRAALDNPENAGFEIGGVLVGSLPTAYSSTIRIESIEMIPRSPHDGVTFMLDPGQQDRFAEVRWRSRDRDRVAVGMFRSHLRPGSIGPSLADRTLLTSEFTGPVYALLLVQAANPHSATFYVAAHGQLPVEPSIRSFRFDENEFRALPEMDVDALASLPPAPVAPRPVRRRWKLPALLGLVVAIIVAALFFFTDVNRILGNDSQLLNLTVHLHGPQLQIDWNRSSHDLDNASGGTLAIRSSLGERTITLGVDELRLGSVAVELPSTLKQGDITLTVAAPNASPIVQTTTWAR